MGQQPRHTNPRRRRRGARAAGGDEVEVHVEGPEFALRRKPGREDLLKRLRAFRGRLPADFVFDRDEANER